MFGNNRWRLLSFVALPALAGFVLIGCANQPTASPPPEPSGQTADGSGSESTPEGLAKLSEADRAAALKQNVCPVTGEKLGSMGKPPKMTVSGRDVFLCCAGCEEELRKEPEKYLAKLDPE